MKKETVCPECYSGGPRATPVKGARECLEKHRQYRCSRCGRLICIDVRGEKKARCFMPFGSAETALLYLRAAEVLSGKSCGIYELIYSRGDKRYRIFENAEERDTFLRKNPRVRCLRDTPVFTGARYKPPKPEQLMYPGLEQINQYLLEKDNQGD
ncbi:hypothetical protein [Breznakiella homolactica]|uniref:Uncharacterized protein n=1 Tax=Breznakiella homolactica TaxID=2798577 RepID=A0A7T7XPH8_9SPIR|nr:hypothetical protein [Breznakiella homolactica]QQO10120.1 hypothetical protein JFL75_04160 [Breznakiella homolactica]